MSKQPNMVAEAALIGSAVLSWNAAHTLVHGIFWRISRLSLAESNAVFFALKQDSAQRDITLALARVTLAGHPDLLREMKAAFKDLSNLAGERNAAVHTLWIVHESGFLAPNPHLPMHGSLKPQNHRQQFVDFITAALQIGDRLMSVHQRIVELSPSPDNAPQQTQPPTASS